MDEPELEGTELKGDPLIRFLSLSLNEFTFSTRVRNLFEKFGVKTLADLIQLRDYDVLRWRGLGLKSLREIRDELAEYDLSLNMTIRDDVLDSLHQVDSGTCV